MTLHISLPQELESLVHQEVKKGMYGSASEVVREALRDFFDAISGRQLRDLAEIREEVQEERRKLLAGETQMLDGETAFAQLRAKHGLDA